MPRADGAFVSAGVAFYAFLALVPALIMIVTVYGLVAKPAGIQRQVRDFGKVLSDEVQKFIQQQITSIGSASRAGVSIMLLIAIAIALWSASDGMAALVTGVNVARDQTEPKSFIKKRSKALALTFGAVSPDAGPPRRHRHATATATWISVVLGGPGQRNPSDPDVDREGRLVPGGRNEYRRRRAGGLRRRAAPDHPALVRDHARRPDPAAVPARSRHGSPGVARPRRTGRLPRGQSPVQGAGGSSCLLLSGERRCIGPLPVSLLDWSP